MSTPLYSFFVHANTCLDYDRPRRDSSKTNADAGSSTRNSARHHEDAPQLLTPPSTFFPTTHFERSASRQNNAVAGSSTAGNSARRPQVPAHKDLTTHFEEDPSSLIPRWVSQATKWLRSVSTEPDWVALTDAWLALEVAFRYDMLTPLDMTCRPALISKWIHDGRAYTREMPVPNPAALPLFSRSLRMYWMTISPAWRGSSWPLQQVRTRTRPRDWETVAHTGPNGMWLVLLGLSWWFVAAPTSAPLRELIQDVTWALDMMTPSDD
ncbi:hypothetical protein EUX98_g8460 [Antrodiella citrinella]|uniref:Uncharacterized protein n=1 Tax=Antrodiella citrinella TaxID=2447956 RepID=A0A4S4M6Y5_9APHY|nr:hypothetical protein EUX98_g8460 [Antrodiella citrinella]